MMDRIYCSNCNEMIGYIIYCGPTGNHYCVSCGEEEMNEDEEE